MADPRFGRVTVSRTSSKDVGIRDLLVQIDDLPDEVLAFDKSMEWELPAGPHTLKATNRLFTKTETFELVAEATESFVVANVPGGCFGAFLIIGGAGAYRVSLERTTPGRQDR